MEKSSKISTRKKFLVWGATVLSAVAFTKFIPGAPKVKKSEENMVKMLTQDGKLVEIDARKLSCGKRKKINDEELKNWVTKQKPLI